VSVVETVRAKMRGGPKGPEEELRAKLARAEQGLEAAQKPYAAAFKEYMDAVGRNLFAKTPALKQKVDRLREELEKAKQIHGQIAAELADLEREKRLPAPWREALARRREVAAAEAGLRDQLAAALRGARLEDVRRLRTELEGTSDSVLVAESAVRNLAEADRAAARKTRTEKLAAGYARLRELVAKIDSTYGGLVALAVQAEREARELQALGEPMANVLGLGWTPEALEIWRRGAWREVGGGPSSAA
jgi:hypothetical protein